MQHAGRRPTADTGGDRHEHTLTGTAGRVTSQGEAGAGKQKGQYSLCLRCCYPDRAIWCALRTGSLKSPTLKDDVTQLVYVSSQCLPVQ